jgi:tryptophan synthase beta chain
MDLAGMLSLTAPELLRQDASVERYIEIPEPVLQVYRQWRPTPLFRARSLERHLGTPAHIYYKYEGVSPSGSHKANTAVPQVYFNAEHGTRRLTTETGAGQWGTALAYACAQFGVECEVFWAGSSFDQKPYRRVIMETFGAKVHRSPSELTAVGRKAFADDPRSPGSIGLAVSEAVEVALADSQVGYAIGSAVNHVLLHQTVIGEEALRQFELAGDYPDVLISCVGGGSSLGGLATPFLREKLAGGRAPRVIAVEPTACPVLTRGRYAWDHGDSEGLTPLMKMHTLGHRFAPDPIHAGGLRYHGMAPLVSHLCQLGHVEAVAKSQRECFAAGLLFAQTEGIIAAPEATHAIAACVEEAIRCRDSGEQLTMLMVVTGHGHFDMSAYADYLAGDMPDLDAPEAKIQESLAALPQIRTVR